MTNKKFLIISVTAGTILVVGSFFVYNRLQKNTDPDAKLTLQEAAEIGEAATHKLLVQIENPQGRVEDISGRYERGDIVLILPASHQFSPAEKEGFLILQMELTPKQGEILVRAKEEEKTFWEKMRSEPEPAKALKRRKFTIDLQKIGIAPEDQKGREISDKTFKWDILGEK